MGVFSYLHKPRVDNIFNTLNSNTCLLEALDRNMTYDEADQNTSAMLVETMTFRKPRSAGSNAASCSSMGSPAWSACNFRRVALRGSLVEL